ncbi:hypothetical protein F8M41_003413 [Gigaspora margarita]|uniref:Uncharacterized protein n=1 Tax=Gigaspora margarita TaxID=4874 RepID=A0A8H4EV98_GIGMA|nr:hypothetical protein F8M41_003413 [Gigaspora margarita]
MHLCIDTCLLEPSTTCAVEMTVRALHYAKHEVNHIRKDADAFNNYKISLENIKEFAKESVNLERKVIFPYSYVKEKYEKLLKEHEDCEKQLHPILIHVIMNKQEILDINVPRVDSLLLSYPPRADDSEINSEDEPDRNSEWDLDDCAQSKGIVKKIYKRGIEVACVPITVFGQNMSILSELKKFNKCQHIKF